MVGHKSEVYEHNIKELQLLKDQLDDTGDIESQTKNIVWWMITVRINNDFEHLLMKRQIILFT